MIAVIVKLNVKDGCETEFETAMLTLVSQVNENEPGNGPYKLCIVTLLWNCMRTRLLLLYMAHLLNLKSQVQSSMIYWLVLQILLIWKSLVSLSLPGSHSVFLSPKETKLRC
jgi:hypothetical protein